MSWKSLMTSLPDQPYRDQRHAPTAESRVNPVSKEWVTPAHPMVSSRQRHMVGLGRDSSKSYTPKYGNDGSTGRTPPVAQVHPNMPSRPTISSSDRANKPSVGFYHIEAHKMQRDTQIEGCEANEQPHHTDWKSDMKVPDGESFSALNLEETMDLPPADQYVYPNHRKDFDSYGLTSKLQRAHLNDYDIQGNSNQTDDYSTHGRRPVPVQAQLTYNSGQGVLSSPQKYRASSGSLRSPGRYSSTATSGYSAGIKGQDLGHWQQLHQQQLKQHYDQLQHIQTGLAQGSSNGSGSPHYQQSVNTVLAQDPNKWDALIRAKESILQEKNMIIEKQKFQINQLREQVREQEAKERHRLMTRFEDGDVVALKMQEYQYENASLKAQIAELASTKNMDVDQFSRKLGQTEYELEETKAALRELALDKKKGLEDIRKQLNDKEEHIMDLSSEYKRVRDKYEKLKNRKDSLERYLEDLPTAEEHLKKSDELKHLKDKDSILSEKISQLEKLLSASKKTIRSKDIKMSALESKYSDMKIEVESLQDKLNKVTQKKLRTDGDANTSIDDDIDELKFQRDQLNAECERLKKLVESKHNKQKSMQAQHRIQIQQVEERLQQEEDTVTALREALSSKEESMKTIQISMKELATQSQEMYEHNLNLQEKVQEYEQSLTSETMKVYNKLMKEMTACIVDLRGITQICTQRAEGKDPNISMLLGLRSSSVACEYEEDVDPTSVETMKHKLIQIREMRQEIEKLRTLISDKYAEDIGDNCITQ